MKLRLDQVLRERGISATTVAKQTGLTDAYISQLRNHHRQPSPATLLKLAEALNVPMSALVENETRHVPVVGRIGAGAQVILVDAYAKGDGLFHIICPQDMIPASIVAVEVVGESMAPLVEPGDILLFTRHFLGVDPRVLNHVGICETDDGRALLKQIKPGREPGTFDLFSINPTHPPEYGARLVWAAPYRRHLRQDDIGRA